MAKTYIGPDSVQCSQTISAKAGLCPISINNSVRYVWVHYEKNAAERPTFYKTVIVFNGCIIGSTVIK